MRKSKPAALCLHLQDVRAWLFPNAFGRETYWDTSPQFQREPKDFGTLERLDELTNLAYFIPRVDCEDSLNFLQLLPYVVLMTHDGRIVGYNRASKGNGEARLAGNFSIGFGGHVEILDTSHTFGNDITDWLDSAITRELDEEIYLKGTRGVSQCTIPPAVFPCEFQGIICSDDSPVDSVHLGLVYIVRLHTEDLNNLVAMTNEPDQIINPRLLTLEQARAEANPESWTAKILNSNLLWDEV